MNQEQRWLLVFAAIWLGRVLFSAREPRRPPLPPWLAAVAAIVGLFATWAATRGERGAKMTDRQRVTIRWWVVAMTLTLVVSVAMMLTSAVPPRWFASVAL